MIPYPRRQPIGGINDPSHIRSEGMGLTLMPYLIQAFDGPNALVELEFHDTQLSGEL